MRASRYSIVLHEKHSPPTHCRMPESPASCALLFRGILRADSHLHLCHFRTRHPLAPGRTVCGQKLLYSSNTKADSHMHNVLPFFTVKSSLAVAVTEWWTFIYELSWNHPRRRAYDPANPIPAPPGIPGEKGTRQTPSQKTTSSQNTSKDHLQLDLPPPATNWPRGRIPKTY